MSKESKSGSSISNNADYSCDKYNKSVEECKMNDDYIFLWSAKRFKAYYEDNIIIYDEPLCSDNENDNV